MDERTAAPVANVAAAPVSQSQPHGHLPGPGAPRHLLTPDDPGAFPPGRMVVMKSRLAVVGDHLADAAARRGDQICSRYDNDDD